MGSDSITRRYNSTSNDLVSINNDPATGSLMPSISTGGAAKKEAIKTKVKIKIQGNIRTPNQPTYNLLLEEKINPVK